MNYSFQESDNVFITKIDKRLTREQKTSGRKLKQISQKASRNTKWMH